MKPLLKMLPWLPYQAHAVAFGSAHALVCKGSSCTLCGIIKRAKEIEAASAASKIVIDSLHASAEPSIDERIAQYFPIKLARTPSGGFSNEQA